MIRQYNSDSLLYPRAGISELPPQAIPTNKKDENWKKATMDALENIGLSQMKENQRFNDVYKMIEGKLSFMEIKDILPHLREVVDLRERADIPSFLKHYDLIGIIIKAFVGWLSQTQDKYVVESKDELEINEYRWEKQERLNKLILERWMQKMDIKLYESGIDPYLDEFNSEEERQQYQQELYNRKLSMMPEDIQKFMNSQWVSLPVKWANETLKQDRERFYMDELDQENFVDYLATGRCFRCSFVGPQNYKPEVWSPKNTFFSKNINCKYPQYGSYIGRVHYFTGDEVLSRYGDRLYEKQKRQIIGGTSYYSGFGYNEGSAKGSGIIPQYENVVVPFEGYFDYQAVYYAQEYTNSPMGETTYLDKEGNRKTVQSYLPPVTFGNYGGSNRFAASLSRDGDIRKDLYQVTEAFWISYQQVYFITYQSESGVVMQEMVTDELVKDFLKENGIEKIKKTYKEGLEEPEVNTYFADYIPKVYKGTKISGGNLQQEAIYLDCEEMDFQIPSETNLFDTVLPVSGYIGDCLADKCYTYQMDYNHALNKLRLLSEKELGKFLITDVRYIPSQYKEFGETDEALFALTEAARDLQLIGLDTKTNPLRPDMSTIHNNFATIDMSRGEEMSKQIELSEFYKNKLFEQIGITQQSLGTPGKYETAEGIRQGVSATMLQTTMYFNNFDNFKKRALDSHLAVAQACQVSGKDITIMYRNSDLTMTYLQLNAQDLEGRMLNVKTISNSKTRQEVETFKQYIMQLNTLNADIVDLARIYTSNSMQEIVQAARQAQLSADARNQEKYQQQSQLQAQEAQEKQQQEAIQHEYNKEIETIKSRAKIETAAVTAAGRAADKESDAAGMAFVEKMTDATLKQNEIDSNVAIEKEKVQQRDAESDRKFRLEMQKLKLQAESLTMRSREDATKRLSSILAHT